MVRSDFFRPLTDVRPVNQSVFLLSRLDSHMPRGSADCKNKQAIPIMSPSGEAVCTFMDDEAKYNLKPICLKVYKYIRAWIEDWAAL